MIDILIPVLARPQRAEDLVRNITRVTKEHHHILFLCSLGDEAEIDACLATGEDVCVMPFPAGPGDFAKKINAGYRHTEGEFIQIGADDLVFHEGWDQAIFRAMEGHHASVMGTNDLHNPRVKRRMHSTHPFIPRAYIEDWNGTYDHTGEIFCELYDHQYVDDELVQTATLRRRWIFVQDSHVEHLHPYFGGMEMDPTYEKALRSAREDYRLFSERLRQIRRLVPRERRRKQRSAR